MQEDGEERRRDDGFCNRRALLQRLPRVPTSSGDRAIRAVRLYLVPIVSRINFSLTNLRAIAVSSPTALASSWLTARTLTFRGGGNVAIWTALRRTARGRGHDETISNVARCLIERRRYCHCAYCSSPISVL